MSRTRQRVRERETLLGINVPTLHPMWVGPNNRSSPSWVGWSERFLTCELCWSGTSSRVSKRADAKSVSWHGPSSRPSVRQPTDVLHSCACGQFGARVCGWARLAHFHSIMCVYHTQNLFGCLTAVGQRKTGMGRPGTTGGTTEGGLTEEGLTVQGSSWMTQTTVFF